jgi:hypothetical protein
MTCLLFEAIGMSLEKDSILTPSDAQVQKDVYSTRVYQRILHMTKINF